MGMVQKEGEDVEDFMDSVTVQGKGFDCINEQLLPSIMNGTWPDLQEAILCKDPDIMCMIALRKAAVFAQACKPAMADIVMVADNRQQCHTRSPSPYRQHTTVNGSLNSKSVTLGNEPTHISLVRWVW